MSRTKLRRALASVILVSAVLLLVQPAGAAPRGGGGREGVRTSLGILAHWEHQARSFLISMLEKAGNSLNPDGMRASRTQLSPDGGH
jgi:hypothetical protein